MKKALISPIEIRHDNNGNEGVRVAAVVEEEFPVADPLYWIGCPDECVQDEWIYVDGEFVEVSPPQVDHPEPTPPIDTIITI
jgi:hypothetical protein